MAVQYSIQKMVSDGTLSTIALGIQYLQRNDIYMRIAGEETPQSGAPSGYTWSFINNTTLKILPVVPNGVEVVVYRRTDIDAMYNIYSQNAQFDEATIDENNQQLLYIAQEYLEQGIPGAGVDTLEFVRDDGTYTYYRIKRTDGSYSEEFTVPSASSSTKVLTRESLRRSYAEAGFNLVEGSFEAGGTLTHSNDVLLQEGTGKAYTHPGPYPKIVAVGTSPTEPGFKDVSSRAGTPLNIENYGAKADFDPANPTIINTNSSQALYLACQDALKLGGGIVWIPTRKKYFYIDDTTAISNLWELSQPDSTDAPRIIGESMRGSKIAFDAKGDTGKTFLFGRYPSGWPTSAAIENLTLLAVNGGQGVVTEGACFAYAHRVYFQGFDVAYYLSNGTAGRFSELSSLSMCWFRYNKTALKLRKDSGNDSYNGFNLNHNLIEVDPGCVGIDIGAGCFVYNSTWQGSFAGSGTYILNNGSRVLATDDFHFEGAGSVDNRGRYSVEGFWHYFGPGDAPLNDVSTKPITVGASYTTPLNYKASPLAGFPCKPKGSVFRSADRAPGGFFPVRAAGIDSSMYVGYRGYSDWDNGLFMGSSADDNYSLENARVHYCLSLNGVKAFASNGFGFVHVNYPADRQFNVTSRGRGDAKLGYKQTVRVTANPSPQTIVATNLAAVGSDKTRMLSIRIRSIGGDLIDIRRVYLTVDAAYGSNFTAVPIGNVMNIDDGSTSVVFNDASVISKPAGISMTLTTSQDVDVEFTLVGIGDT